MHNVRCMYKLTECKMPVVQLYKMKTSLAPSTMRSEFLVKRTPTTLPIVCTVTIYFCLGDSQRKSTIGFAASLCDCPWSNERCLKKSLQHMMPFFGLYTWICDAKACKRGTNEPQRTPAHPECSCLTPTSKFFATLTAISSTMKSNLLYAGGPSTVRRLGSMSKSTYVWFSSTACGSGVQ